MNPITTAGPISTLAVKPSAAPATAKTEAAAAEGAKAFSSLLQSLSESAQDGVSQELPLPKALLKKIEDMLATLQEQPVEELTEAQQKIMYELMQIINVQPERKEGTVLVDISGRRKFTPLFPDPPKQEVSREVQAKLVELVKKLGELLPGMNTVDNKKFDSESPFMGVEGKAKVLNAETIANITKKIMEFTDSLDVPAKKTATATVPIEQAVKLGMIPSAEPEKQLKSAGEAKAVNIEEAEATKGLISAAVVTATRSDGGQQQETSQQEDTKQNVAQPVASTDSAKPTAAPQTAPPLQARAEPTAMPTPMVRMTNLTEELGEVFKNSLRMTTNGESTQIKVNISPDHLGHLDIRLTETNGKIAAQIFTSSIAAKDALDLQLNQLRQTLLQQGLTVEKIEVVQNSSQQSLGQQNAQAEQRFAQQQRQNAANRENNGYQQTEEKAAVERNHLDTGMMKVDYTV